MTILDPDRSRIVSIDFVDNPYHGTYADESGELCRMAAKDGTRRVTATVQHTSFQTGSR